MNWIQRYLQALAPYLPKQQRQDICAELEANLLDQMDERASAGGPANADVNAKALITELGHPARYASGFQTRQALISQPLLEIYKQTLQWLLWVLIGLFCAIALIESLSRSEVRPIAMVLHVFSNTLDYFVWGFAIITAVFFLAEEQLKKLNLLNNWQPDDLPAIQPSWNTLSQSESAFGCVTYTVFAAWMFGWISPFNTWHLTLTNDHASGLYNLLLPALGVIAICFALHRLYLCFVPYWQKPTLAINIALNSLCLVALALLLNLPTDQLPIFVSTKVAIQPLLSHLSESFRWALMIIAGFSLYEILRDGYRWNNIP